MFFERLTCMLFEHAAYFRVMTIEEYEFGIIDDFSHEMEYRKLHLLWDEIVSRLAWINMVYTVDFFEIISFFDSHKADYFSWKLRNEN